MKYIFTTLLLFTLGIYAQTPPAGGHHGHAGHNEHIHKTLHPHMHLHKKNYLNAIKVEMGLTSGTYYGELCDNTECFTFRPGLHAGINYRYSKRFVFRSQLSYLSMSSKDRTRDNASRNLSFLTHGVEFNVGAVYDILKFEPLYFRRIDIAPYLHAGIGVLQYSPTTRLNGEWYRLRPIQTEGKKYSQFAFVVPFGFGLRFKLLDHWDICTEFGYRYTSTDYLDDVSTQYKIKPVQSKAEFDEAIANPTRQNLQKLLSDRSWELNNYDYDRGKFAGWYYYHYTVGSDGKLVLSDPDNGGTYRNRGNSSKKDGYFTFNVRAEYTIKVTKQRIVSFNKAYNPRFRSRKR
jgi:Domain of unknown function (DUF6089)